MQIADKERKTFIKSVCPLKFNITEELKALANNRVMFAIPTRGNDIYWQLAVYLFQQSKIFKEIGLLFGLSGWQAASQHLFNSASVVDADFFQFLDSDIGPHHETTLQLMSHDLDMVTAPVWHYSPVDNDIHLNVHRKTTSGRVHTPGTGLEPIASSSLACLLVKRRVFDVFLEAGESFCSWSPLIDKELDSTPTDVIFFAKAKKLGLQLWVDWDVTFPVHHKYVGLCQDSIEKFVFNRRKELIEASQDNDQD
mgnify:CR=1 FL=1